MNQTEQTLILLTDENSNFCQNVVKFREYIEIPVGGFKEDKELSEWLYSLHFKSKFAYAEFRLLLEEFFKSFEISDPLMDPLLNFLFFNSYKTPNVQATVILNRSQKELSILINADTKKSDIDYAWKAIRKNKLQNNLPFAKSGKFKEIETFPLQKKCYEVLRIEKLQGKQAWEQVLKSKNPIIIKQAEKYGYQDIYTLAKRYQENIGITDTEK